MILNSGRRQRIGAIVQSTSENSSLKKNFFAEKISTLERMLSSRALTARPIQRYMDEVFSRPSFQASLTEFEQEIRQ